jgi:hypothetical protein
MDTMAEDTCPVIGTGNLVSRTCATLFISSPDSVAAVIPPQRLRIRKVSKKCPSKPSPTFNQPSIYEGAGSRIRTDDLLITNHHEKASENIRAVVRIGGLPLQKNLRPTKSR